MGGLTDWIEQVADSKDAMDYRRRISEPETASMWQSLSHGATTSPPTAWRFARRAKM
jgi:hypothetical protein